MKGKQASLLIETPEANLDAIFIPKAGYTLNNFVKTSEPNHILVATSNLNGTNMVKALLGYIGESGERLPEIDDASSKVLNLLDIAYQNTALLKYKSEYVRSYDSVVHLEVEKADGED